MSVLNKVLSVCLCIIMLSCCMVGCGENTEDAIIYFELLQRPHTLDPQKAQSDSELMVVRNIFEGLMREDADGKIVCGAAESYTYENFTYTFKLRNDAVWSNGDKLTAQDFQYGFSRAVDPKIKAPFVSRLYCIENAEAIANGNADISTLGVKAIDQNTLQIKLCREDENFLKNLTTSVSMPCNEKFFEESIGKYGLDAACILSNGSYRLTKWNREEDFGIRLYKNEEYNGTFKAKNAAVFISCVEDETQVSRITDQKSDMSFLSGSELSAAQSNGLALQDVKNTCWVLTVSEEFTPEIRRSFALAFSPSVYENSLPAGFGTTTTVYPPILGIDADEIGMEQYDIEQAKTLLSQNISSLPDGKFPQATLYYYDVDGIKSLATAIVGHWQQNLGTFINIEPVDDLDTMQSELKDGTRQFALFPITATSNLFDEYAEKLSNDFKDITPQDFQRELLQDCNIIPVAYQTTNVAYISSLQNVSVRSDNGYIDFSWIVKN